MKMSARTKVLRTVLKISASYICIKMVSNTSLHINGGKQFQIASYFILELAT